MSDIALAANGRDVVASPVTFRLRAAATTWLRALAPILTLALLAGVEEYVVRIGLVSASRFPPVSAVLRTLSDEILSGSVWKPFSQTLLTWFLSLALSFLLALPLGLLVGVSRTARDLLSPILEFLRPIPSTALIPLVILTIGVNIRGATFLTVFGTIWQILPMVVRSVSSVEPVSRDTALAFGFSPWQRIRWVTLPSMEPYLLTALRIGGSAALILLVGMELLTGVTGVGREISIAYEGANLPRMYAYVLLSGLMGFTVNLVLGALAAARSAAVQGTRQ